MTLTRDQRWTLAICLIVPFVALAFTAAWFAVMALAESVLT